MTDCKDQDEVDRYWTALGEGGETVLAAGSADKFGLSWQVIPTWMNGACWPPRPGPGEPSHAGRCSRWEPHRR